VRQNDFFGKSLKNADEQGNDARMGAKVNFRTVRFNPVDTKAGHFNEVEQSRALI
jgi:hypothetical protein